MKAAKYIRINHTDDRESKKTIKHTSEGIQYIEVIDKCRSNTSFKDRSNAKSIYSMAENNTIDTLLVNSIKCLGKNSLDITSTISELTEMGVNIKSEKEKLHTLNKDGSKNKIILIIMNLIASLSEQELEQKLEKQMRGIRIAKEKGAYKSNGGNKPKLTYEQFIAKEKNSKCLKELKKGESIRRSAKLSGVSLGTSVKIKKLAEINGDIS
ncbi:MAG: resolvase [Flavobacteriaceae bacterium]|nr:resolvase [Flavobacteriaceae bacterium]|tara:strand:+ start:54970 stop:55602 length:633 start_codon:yes stop_codon:yes gene_type:complete